MSIIMVTLNLSQSVKNELFEEDFDPQLARQAMRIICTAYFAENPVETEPGVQYCNSTFDSFSCWPTTRAGRVAVVHCPDVSVTNPTENVTKECYENGTWAPANYEACFLETPRKQHFLDHWYGKDTVAVRIIYDTGYIVTTIALLIALAIFIYFKSLRCLRNSIHCNLIIAFIFNNLSWFILRYAISYNYPDLPSWLCKVFVAAVNYFHSVPFFWMFVEGLYLFTIVVWAFSAQKIRLWYYMIIGWVVPLVITCIWILAKARFENIMCWLPVNDLTYDYIIHGPVMFVLASNVFFITAIIWVLVTKLRASNTLETRQSRKAVKATVVLLPLLGVTYVLFLEPPINDPVLRDIFKYLNAALQSFQGLFVAIFYCFLNGEVQSLLRQRFHTLRDSRTLSRCTKSSIFGSPRRSSCYAMTLANGKTGGRKLGHSTQAKITRIAEAETEASASMMDNIGGGT